MFLMKEQGLLRSVQQMEDLMESGVDQIIFPNEVDDDAEFTHYFIFVQDGNLVLYLGTEATFARYIVACGESQAVN